MAACVSIMEAVILTSVKSVRNRDKIQALSKKKEDNNLVILFWKKYLLELVCPSFRKAVCSIKQLLQK